MTAPRITDGQRRARLVARHHVGRTADGVVAAVASVAACHSSDPVTPYLGMWARVPGFTTTDLGRELHDRRSLWRLHAMRRTLFVVPSGDARVFEAAAGRSIAAKERQRLEVWLGAELGADSVPDWVAQAEARVLEVLADGDELRTAELTAAVPELAREITLGSGKWATRSRVSSRLLFVMAMDGRIVRTRPTGSWRSSQYRWAAADSWFGPLAEPLDPAAGRVELARRYLATHGPVTEIDLRWWTGWTAVQARAALADLGAVEVALDSSSSGYVLPDDLDVDDAEPMADLVALLPGLDSTPMGWKERDWYLGPHADRLYDANGNAGPTVWVAGRAVGVWGQRPDGEVVHRLLDDVGGEAADAVEAETAALTRWLAGTVVASRFRTELERELSS